MDDLLTTVNANIKVLLVIDTDYIKTNHDPNNDGPDSPQRVEGKALRIIYTGARSAKIGNEGIDLILKAKKEDHITFRAISCTGNNDDAVILYKIKHKEGVKVFSSFITDIEEIGEAAVPDPDTREGQGPLQETHGQLDFTSQDGRIKRLGTEILSVRFAVYNLDDNGVMQDLYGYFEWNAKLTVEK
jgi:hypothetical protein